MKKFISTALILFLSVSFMFSQNIRFGMKTGINLASSVVTNEYIEVSNKYLNYSTSESDDFRESYSSFDNSEKIYLALLHLDFFMNLRLSEKFSFQPELSFSQQGYRLKLNESNTNYSFWEGDTHYFSKKGEVKVNTNYLNVPLLLKFKTSNRSSIVLGPQVGFLLSGQKYTRIEQQFNTLPWHDNAPNNFDISKGGTFKTTETNSTISPELKPIVISISAGAQYFISKKIFIEAKYNIGLTNEYKSKDTDSFIDELKGPIKSKSRIIQTSIAYIF